MGYRSQVILAVAPEAASAFMAMLAKYPKAMELCSSADTFHSGYEQEGDWMVYWSYIKWYDSYEDVGPIETFVNALDADDLGEHGEPDCPKDEDGNETQWHNYFRFIRVGEENDDVEDRGWGFENIQLQRSIVY